MKLPENIKRIANLSVESEIEFEKISKRQELPKGSLLFQQGEVCRHIFYIEKGLARVYYHSGGGKEITAWFSADNSFITAIDSLYCHKPTRDYCELLEDSVIYKITYTDLEAMLNKKPELARLTFHVLYDIAKQMTEFIVSIKFQTAEERYNALMNDYPSIFQRASLGSIASYLGITQETLSRIRGKV